MEDFFNENDKFVDLNVINEQQENDSLVDDDHFESS